MWCRFELSQRWELDWEIPNKAMCSCPITGLHSKLDNLIHLNQDRITMYKRFRGDDDDVINFPVATPSQFHNTIQKSELFNFSSGSVSR